MRLSFVDITESPPIKRFTASDLADVIVLAGPNGVGKTRLVGALLGGFRSPGSQKNVRLRVQATSETERLEWATNELDTAVAEQAQKLAKTLQKGRRRTHWESSVFQFESDRGNLQYNPFSFSWDAVDPWDEVMGWEHSLTALRNRYQDTVNSLFRKVHAQTNAIAAKGRELIKAGGGKIDPADFPDPLAPFKDAFRQLLAPKELLDPDPKDQTLYYTLDGTRYPLSSLSSGEREVVNIVFDFLLRDPSDSIIVFDEPELHLHPELSYKLLHTLRTVGTRNQFVFVTHSPDIITASIEHSVVFISPPKADGGNQAVPVREDDSTHEALRLIGQSIGIVSLGKRIVLIEGARTSLDKQTYGAILKNRFPNLVLVPSGGRSLIAAFNAINDSVLSRSLWGVDFFMLCDRDAVPLASTGASLEAKSQGRLHLLSRYHLENYFLDEAVLARIFEEWVPPDSWLRKPELVRERLLDFARENVSYATALIVSAQFRDVFGNVDVMPKGSQKLSADDLVVATESRRAAEAARFAGVVQQSAVEAALRETYSEMTASLDSDEWKRVIPGKQVLEMFASAAGVPSGRVKLRYIAEAERHNPSPFADVTAVFQSFAQSDLTKVGA